MKTIKVNKLCKINQDNIATCRENREIAINIIAQKNDDIDFNYVLAIDNEQQCCEQYGVVLKKLHNGDNEVFIERIEHDVEIPKELLKEVDEYMDFSWGGGYTACNVYGTDNELLYIAFVYNDHNGYYAHKVYMDINGKTEVDWL